MTPEIFRFPSIHKATGLSRTTIWRLERAGLFPRRRQLSPNTVGWPRAEIEEWLATRSLVSISATKVERA